MKSYDIIITPAAEEDLTDIFRYIANELLEHQAAINLCNLFEQAINKLSTMPHRHSVYPREPWLSRGVRFFPVANFLVYYITRESDSTVHILRILYSGRNIENHL